MLGRFRSSKVPELTREVPNPAPLEYVIAGRTYKLTLETAGSSDEMIAVYVEVPASEDLA